MSVLSNDDDDDDEDDDNCNTFCESPLIKDANMQICKHVNLPERKPFLVFLQGFHTTSVAQLAFR